MQNQMNGGLLGSFQPQQPPQAGGLLEAYSAGAQPAQAGGMPMPPDLVQAIEQMKNAPPEQRQEFIQKVAQTIQSAPKDPAQKQQALQQFMQAMGVRNE